MLELIPVTYVDAKGQTQTTHVPRGKPMVRRIENFCRMVASGEYTPFDAYLKSYEKSINDEHDKALAAHYASALMGRTDVILRIQQLRSPVIPEIARKYTYSLDKAMDECQTAWDLACAQGHVPSMLKCIEMRARLNKMLSDQLDVTHKHQFLDETGTDILLQMKKQLEDVKAKRKQLQGPVVDVEPVEA